MKICIINPPIEDFYSTSIRRQPLGILYIIASLEAAGYDITFINGHSPKKHILPIPKELSFLNDFIKNKNKNLTFPFKNYCHFGLSFQEIERQIKVLDCEIFLISSLFTTYYQETEQIIEIIRKNHDNPKIIVGGYHGALHPQYFLDVIGIDFVIHGEGEVSVVELINCIENNMDFALSHNLAYYKNGKIIKTPKSYVTDLDTLPYPARHFLKDRDFKVYKNRAVSMITSRGCPNNCFFCSGKSVWQNSYRVRSVESVIEEISQCIFDYNINMINFEDDNIFANPKHTNELLVGLIKCQRAQSVSLDLTAMNGISIENLDTESIDLMKRAGFKELNISLMSYSADIQRNYNRPFSSEHFSRIALHAKKIGFNVRSYFILGLPGQTKKEVEESICFLKSQGIGVFPSVYYDVNSPNEQWKMQRSSAFFNETEYLLRKDLIYYFNLCSEPFNQ